MKTTLEDYLYDESIENNSYPSIIHDYKTTNPSVVDRFFTRYYKIFSDEKENEDHIILFHSNRICLIGLAQKHIAFKKGIDSIRFDIGNIDRGKNNVKGKGKKGGMALQPNSTIAIIKCKDNSEYRIQSCITAKLIEINKNLIDNPELINIEGQGYVAIVLVKPENCDLTKDKLFSQLQYDMIRNDDKPTETMSCV